VEVGGIRGAAPTDFYKVSISYRNGYKAIGQLTIAGPDALEKARICADIIWKRLEYDGVTFPDDCKMVEFLGTNVCHAGIAAMPDNPAEVVLRIGVKDAKRNRVDRFGMEIVPLVTSGPPGVTGFAGGRPKATGIISYWPALLRKELAQPVVTVEEF